MSVLATQPSNIIEVFESSIKVFKLSFKKIIGLGIIIGLIQVASGIISEMIIKQQSSMGADAVLNIIPRLSAMGFLMTLCAFIVYAAIIYRIDNVVKMREDSFSGALMFSVRKFPALLLALILYGVATFVGTILLIIPGLILGLSLAFYVYFIVLENENGYQALKSSHRLVWKDWWRTLAVFAVPGVILIIALIGISFVFEMLGFSKSGYDGVTIATNFLACLYMPYFYALGYVQYHDLKLRKSENYLDVLEAD